MICKIYNKKNQSNEVAIKKLEKKIIILKKRLNSQQDCKLFRKDDKKIDDAIKKTLREIKEIEKK